MCAKKLTSLLAVFAVACGGNIAGGGDAEALDGTAIDGSAVDDSTAPPSLTGAACRAPDGGTIDPVPTCEASTGTSPSPECGAWWSAVGNSDFVAACAAPHCALVVATVPCAFGSDGDAFCAEHFQRLLGMSGTAYGRCSNPEGSSASPGVCVPGDHCSVDTHTGTYGCACGDIGSSPGPYVCGRRVPNGPLEWLPTCAP